MDNRFDQTPVFENGIAQPVFPFTDGKSGEKYDPQTSAIVRYCVYVESDYDTDGDGKNDLIKAFIQVPRSAAEGNYKAATVFEARPYCAGVNEDGYDHMKEVESDEYPEMDIYALTRKVLSNADGNTAGSCDCVRPMEAAMQADPSDWYYPDSGYEPETSAASITLRAGEAHEYHAYLNPTRCTVPAGHRIAVIIGTEDPVNCLIHKKYSVEIDNASVRAIMPVTSQTAAIELFV